MKGTQDGQYEVISFRPDIYAKDWVKAQMKLKANRKNKSTFYLRIFHEGIKAQLGRGQ